MLDVLEATGAEVVEDHDFVVTLRKRVGEMRADESRPPGYEMNH